MSDLTPRQRAFLVISRHRLADPDRLDMDCTCGWSDPGGDRFVLQEEHVLDMLDQAGLAIVTKGPRP